MESIHSNTRPPNPAPRTKMAAQPDVSGNSAKESDLVVQALAKNPVVQSLAKAHSAMVEQKIKSKTTDSYGRLNELHVELNELSTSDQTCEQLKSLLDKPHLINLLKSHDSVAKNRENTMQLHGTATNGGSSVGDDNLTSKPKWSRAIRMVGLTKKSWEPLGLTVVQKNGELVIARVLHGSAIQRKGLLHVDDVIKEVNGNSLDGDPEKLQNYILKASGSLVFKILPSYEENQPPKLLYVKCHMDYDPNNDEMIPCKEAGLKFVWGDILQVVDQTDDDWWQALHVNNKGEPRGQAGIIPSQSFEEKRRAMKELQRKNNSVTEKKKPKKRKSFRMYSAAQNSAFDKQDTVVYEEVACIPPFSRKTVVLLMRSKTEVEAVCENIVNSKPHLYGKPEKYVPMSAENIGANTSRESVERGSGDELHSKGDKAVDFYGTRLDSVRDIMKEGKACILTVPPQGLKLLKTPEFMPYVVFVKSSDGEELPHEDRVFEMSQEDIEKYYSQYIDAFIENKGTSDVADTIVNKLDLLKTRHQWVPTSWVY